MDQLIPIINELQDTYAKLNMPFIDLPQIVIIGSQSAGKSSVLENIVRREFLPRGTGIVTRCPLILHLIHETDPTKETRARFLHSGDVDFYDFDEIKEEIIRQTIVLAGPDKNISDQPITLKIFSPDFPSLTLIDLPGLTKVSVESQPKDIDEQIRKICLKFARKENSIILAISQGNVDLANSDSLRFAEELDPEGKRTLCVITKLDIMDKGTDAYDILTGKVLRKELGYIGVVSRCQEDIMFRKPIEESLVKEKRFFEQNYPDIAHKNGTAFLTQNLNKLLKKHIKKCLPNLRDIINKKIRTESAKLELLGPEITDKRILIPKFLDSFSRAYIKINDGDFEENLKEIRGGALIAEILYEEFPSILMEINIEHNLTNEMIIAAIQNTCGPDKTSFSREKAFKSLVREQIQKLLNPSLKCIDDVLEKMMEFVDEACSKIQSLNFPNLIQKIVQETHMLIRTRFRATQSLIENLIISEKTDVMCSHPNFKLGFVLENMNYQKFPNAESCILEKEPRNQKDNLIENAFKIVCGNIANNLPEFCRILIYFMTSAKKTMEVIDVFRNQNLVVDGKAVVLDQVIENIFANSPEILQHKNVIVNTALDPNSKFYDSLMNYELNCQLEKSVELRLPVNKEYEYAVLKSLVIEYFNMVRQNVCYYIPKLIKTFLVIHVRENLISHLQGVYNESNIDDLLQESDSIFTQRRNATVLLQELENVKQRIADIFRDV